MIPKTPGRIKYHTKAIHGGFVPSEAFKKKKNVIDFSSNVNPLGIPSSAQRYLRTKDSLFSEYPDPNCTDLTRTISNTFSVSDKNVIVGNGATELIYNFLHAFAYKRRVLIPIPTFSEYEKAAELCGSTPYFFESMDFDKDIDSLLSKIRKCKFVFLCNPNNPTGRVVKRENMIKLLDKANRHSVFVFVDECFMEFCDAHDTSSMIPYLKKYGNLFVLRSLTKFFGLAGIRIGFGISNAEVIDVMCKMKIPWNVNSLAQKMASKCLNDYSFIKKSNRLIKKEKAFLKEQLESIKGIECYESYANFLLVKTCTLSSSTIKKNMLKKNILVRDCSSFRGLDDHHFRVAVKQRRDNKLLVQSLREIMKND